MLKKDWCSSTYNFWWQAGTQQMHLLFRDRISWQACFIPLNNIPLELSKELIIIRSWIEQDFFASSFSGQLQYISRISLQGFSGETRLSIACLLLRQKSGSMALLVWHSHSRMTTARLIITCDFSSPRIRFLIKLCQIFPGLPWGLAAKFDWFPEKRTCL